jgi:hypothetical protein|nr:MAG TPA: Protein of unknown function (DUF2577) [Caudoviricetes sp.]
MKDPFLELYSLMGEATKIEASFFIAKIISPLPNLKIQLNDLPLDKDDFLISKNLLLSNNANISATECSIEHNLKDELKVNDKVVLLRIDDKFIILSKVVSI